MKAYKLVIKVNKKLQSIKGYLMKHKPFSIQYKAKGIVKDKKGGWGIYVFYTLKDTKTFMKIIYKYYPQLDYVFLKVNINENDIIAKETKEEDFANLLYLRVKKIDVLSIV